MRNSNVNPNYKAPLFVCNINKSLDNLNDLDELFFSIKYKVGNEIKTGAISGDIKYGKSFQMELSDAINYSGVKIKYGNMAVTVLPNKRCTNATTTIDDNSYCVLQVRILSGYISEEDINSIKNSVVSVYVRRRNYLTLDNSNEFTPTDTYQPATKKYVDNKFVIDELETVLTVSKSELDKCNDTGAGISPSQNLNVINPNDGKHIYYACYGDIMNEITYTSDKLAGYTGTLCELEDGNVLDLCMTFAENNLVACSTGLASVKNYVFTNDLVIKSKKILAIDEMATKEYVDDNAVILPLPIHTTLESTSVAMNVVNIMDLIPGVQYSTHNNPNETKKQGYKVVYICDDGNFKTISTMPLPNRVVHLLKVLHYTNYSILTVNNTIYKVDYSKHGTVDDVQITQTLQYYLPITNTIEYNPTNDYHPATKKYVDDRFICSDLVENVGTITKEEMQKCNNGTSRYVSSINLKEFFADYKYCAYQGMYGDKSVRMIYDSQYNRIIAYDLDIIDTYDITLGFDFNNNYMYPFSGGASQVKSYQFTNDLVITKNAILNPSKVLTKDNTQEYTPTNDYNPTTKKYVDDKVEQILPVGNISANDVLGRNKNGELIWKEIPNLVCLQSLDKSKPTILSELSSGIYYIFGYTKILRNSTSEIIDYQNYYGLTYINSYTVENIKHMTIDTHIRQLGETLPVFYYITFNKDLTGEPTIEKRLYSTSNKVLEKNNTEEYTPTNDYNPATKKYVDDKVSSLPQFSFNENDELVVTINGVSKTFVPKE